MSDVPTAYLKRFHYTSLLSVTVKIQGYLEVKTWWVKIFACDFPLHRLLGQAFSIHSVINHNRGCYSRESGNPGKHWIPGQARDDKLAKIYVVIYNADEFVF
jgi:hypothetical protein